MRRTNKEWTKDDESRLQQLVEKRASAFRAGIALRRSTTAVQTKARELGLSFRPMRSGLKD